MSRGGGGYGKYRRGAAASHSSFHFDNLFKENSNRPSAARSAATVGKWGITSFTSTRTINGQIRGQGEAESSAPKPKKFFKSRNTEPPDLATSNTYSNSGGGGDLNQLYESSSSNKRARTSSTSSTTSPRKFFSSGRNNNHNHQIQSVSPTQSSEPVISRRNSQQSPDDSGKPPIVLRICRGKSQLVNDSDESESTVTPASTPSPRSTPRPSNCRITRSARRSMQQDPNSSSPATADTPTESILFATSPPGSNDLSPQYIPAEKYELERRAMYDNLLRPNSPENSPFKEIVVHAPVIHDPIHQEPMIHEENSQKSDIHEKSYDHDEKMITKDSDTREKESISPSPSVQQNLLPVQQETTENESVKSNCDWESDSNSSEKATRTAVISQDLESIAPVVAVEQPAPMEGEKEEMPIEDPPPVKLVISKKKGSIFKSRALVEDGGPKKRRAVYRHKWSDDKDKDSLLAGKGSSNEATNSCTTSKADDDDDFDFKDDPLTRITKKSEGGASDDPESGIASVKCTKNDKTFYTVVRNVKKAHQMQEIGEFQEFNDDVEYILDALQDNNPISTRCLSAITLASKCMAPAFRMHVRAHGTVAKFFRALHDAAKDQSLGLCTATVMFVLSQDRLNMDLDRDCLELMLNLLESDVSYQQALDVCGLSSAQLEKNKQKVRELCAEIQSQGHAMHLNLESITVGQLAMETLLSLTSKRAGEWFKEELRELGGLEHIMKTITECCRQVSDYVVAWTDVLLDKLKKVDRCLRVLENVTHNNEENQTYLLKYNDGVILDTLVNLYKLCDGEIPLYPVTDIADKTSTGTIIREALLVTLKVLINLTHHFNKQSIGSVLIGSRAGVIDTSLHLLLQVPHYIPEQKKFELGVLVLMLLINLIQDQDANKKQLIEAKAPSKSESIYSRDESAVEALIVQFYQWEACAKLAEKNTNAILDGEKEEGEESAPTPQHKSNEEFIEETVAKLLQKAGTHMEFTFLASYIVMLIGFLIMDNVQYQNTIRQYLKQNKFTDMVELLKKFFNFMNLTASTEASSVCAVKATQKVIKFLEECDNPVQATDGAATAAQTTHTTQNSTECMDLTYRVS